MRTIAVFFDPGNHRSRMVAKAMTLGVAFAGDKPLLRPSTAKDVPAHDAAIFYGLNGGLHRILLEYAETGRTAIYVDLGYWGRHLLSRHDGYHKLVRNARHPTAYFQQRPKPADRFKALGLSIAPWREEGRHVLVAGMSAKAARAERMKPYVWEEQAVARLQHVTNRPIIFRPKPKCPERHPIPGAGYAPDEPLEDLFRDCHAVVTHHSNVGIDALLAGLPVFSEAGVASVLGRQGVVSIDRPLLPDGREQWAADLAYTQWNIAEIKAGLGYRYLIDEGLIP